MAKTAKAQNAHRIGERLGVNDADREPIKPFSIGGVPCDQRNDTDTQSFGDFFAAGGELEELFSRRRSW